VLEFYDIIRNESGQIDLLKVHDLDQHIVVKKAAIEEEYEIKRIEKKIKKE
jgi:hypothetical protein